MRPIRLPFLLLAAWLACATAATAADVVTSPHALPAADGRIRVFLAGSIDMGGSADWQADAIQRLAGPGVVLFNPRRADWNPAWKPEASEPEFRRQVDWELEALEQADIVLLYFAPGSQSPVTLLEFGLHARGGKLLVAAPDGFWRRGNVEITAQRYGVPHFDSLEALLQAVEQEIERQRATR